jgi:hypothetical protein
MEQIDFDILLRNHYILWAEITQSLRLTTVCTVQGSSLSGGEILCTLPDEPWDLPSLLYNGYRVSLPGVKQAGRGFDHPTQSSAKAKEM